MLLLSVPVPPTVRPSGSVTPAAEAVRPSELPRRDSKRPRKPSRAELSDDSMADASDRASRWMPSPAGGGGGGGLSL